MKNSQFWISPTVQLNKDFTNPVFLNWPSTKMNQKVRQKKRYLLKDTTKWIIWYMLHCFFKWNNRSSNYPSIFGRAILHNLLWWLPEQHDETKERFFLLTWWCWNKDRQFHLVQKYRLDSFTCRPVDMAYTDGSQNYIAGPTLTKE